MSAIIKKGPGAGVREGASNAPADPKVGEWYWHLDPEDPPEELACVTHVGSNYVKLTFTGQRSLRVHAENFGAQCTLESNPERYIEAMVQGAQERIRALLGEIQALTAGLGLQVAGRLGQSAGEVSAQALVHVPSGGRRGAVEQYKAALVKAQQDTLPKLFKKVKEEHEIAARWMQLQLAPLEAQESTLRASTDQIKRRLFTVELYAGLVEDLKQIAGGDPAGLDEPIHLMQRRCYMDEECLADYRAGGMRFDKLEEFDAWLCEQRNLQRILPHPRCVVAMRVRRNRYENGEKVASLGAWIRMMEESELDKATFLYVRNGAQVFRLRIMSTSIEFGERLFPDREHSALLSGGAEKLYGLRSDAGSSHVASIITEGDYLQRVREYKKAKAEHKRARKAWEAAEPDDPTSPLWRRGGMHQPTFYERDPAKGYVQITTDTVLYDDFMKKIVGQIQEHNQLVVLLQGLLDRSEAFCPHPPWLLHTLEGFTRALRLVYDQDRALVSGPPPDFEAYRTRLNGCLKAGCYTIGQQDAWLRHEVEKESARRQANWRYRDADVGEHWKPYGNPGPGEIAKVIRAGKRGCTYHWGRQRMVDKWVDDPEEPGYLKLDQTPIPSTFTCPTDDVLNVSAYTPGDFHQFFDDPRTRAEYLKWAWMLLPAEDWHASAKRGSE